MPLVFGGKLPGVTELRTIPLTAAMSIGGNTASLMDSPLQSPLLQLPRMMVRYPESREHVRRARTVPYTCTIN